MSDREIEPVLIGTRDRAIAAVCITAFLAGQRFWNLIQGRAEKSAWMYPVNSWLPNWVAVPADILTYGLFISALLFLLRRWNGLERVILAILIAQILVSPLRQFLPFPAAKAVLWVQAFADLVMLLAAVSLFLDLSGRRLERL